MDICFDVKQSFDFFIAFVSNVSFKNFSFKKCIKFKYGGCHGTKNLFASKSECEKTCQSSFDLNLRNSRNELCRWPHVPYQPECNIAFNKWAFDER